MFKCLTKHFGNRCNNSHSQLSILMVQVSTKDSFGSKLAAVQLPHLQSPSFSGSTPPATLLQSQLHICNQGNQDHCSLWCRQFCCIYIYAINTRVQSWKEFSASQFSRLYITALPGCCPLPWRGVRWGASVSVGVVLFLGGV